MQIKPIINPATGKEFTPAELVAEFTRLAQENQTLRKAGQSKLSLKIGDKGGLSLYGMGRFPVTLYKEQWSRMLDFAEEIRTFIRENDTQLKSKADSVIEKAKQA